MTELNTLAGIDIGAKLSGTTAIASLQNANFNIQQSKKGVDADAWLLEAISKLKSTIIFIDAPLSLPAAYFDSRSSEFFYREADKKLTAMSPMFLGGLTARAMKLKRILNAQNILVFETYPAALVRELLPVSVFYKKDMKEFRKELQHKMMAYPLPSLPKFYYFPPGRLNVGVAERIPTSSSSSEFIRIVSGRINIYIILLKVLFFPCGTFTA